MRRKAVLNQEQRNFFSLVVKSIYMNAFLDERQEILAQIYPRWYQDRTTGPALNANIDKVDRTGFTRIQDFNDDITSSIFTFLLLIEINNTFLRTIKFSEL